MTSPGAARHGAELQAVGSRPAYRMAQPSTPKTRPRPGAPTPAAAGKAQPPGKPSGKSVTHRDRPSAQSRAGNLSAPSPKPTRGGGGRERAPYASTTIHSGPEKILQRRTLPGETAQAPQAKFPRLYEVLHIVSQLEEDARDLKCYVELESPVLGLSRMAVSAMHALVRLTLVHGDKEAARRLARIFEYPNTIYPGLDPDRPVKQLLEANRTFERERRMIVQRNAGAPRSPFGKWCARLANEIQWWWHLDNRLSDTVVQYGEVEWDRVLSEAKFPSRFVANGGRKYRPGREWVLTAETLAQLIGDLVTAVAPKYPGFLERVGVTEGKYVTEDGNLRLGALRRGIHRAAKWQITVNEPLTDFRKSQ